MTKIDQIAQAFAQGVKFAENLKLAMDAAKGNDDEAGHWVTVGEGEEARPVFIKDKKKAAKKTESKKAESKPAQQRTESKKTRQKASEENIKKAQQLSAYVDQKFKQIARPDIISITETNRGLKMASENIPGAPLSTYDAVKSPVSRIRKNISNIDKAMSSAKDQIKAAARDGKIEKDRVDAELTQYRKYCSKFKDYLDSANDQKYDLFRRANDGHRGVIKNLSNLAELTSKLAKSVTDWRESLENKANEQNAERAESPAPKSQPRAQRSTSGKAQTVKELEDAYNVSADLIDEMTPKQADRPFLTRLDRIHKDAVALAESAPEITNSHELREMTRIMKNADKLVKALPRYYDRNYYGGWVQKIMGMVRGAEEAYTKLKKRKALGPDAAI